MNNAVYSIGYGGRTVDVVLSQLGMAKVEYVIDVRSSPYSRFAPEFSKDDLQRTLADHGLKYVFMGNLLGGRPRDDDCYSEGKVDYAKVRRKPFFRKGIERLKSAHAQGLKVCLMCSEGHPSQCHRSKLISAVLEEEGIPVTHIFPDGSYRGQEAIIRDLTGGQSDFFGDHFTSRKSYR